MAELTNREQSELESETSRYVCHACIGDEVLAQQVANGGTQADCNYCSATGTAIDLTELADLIHQVMEAQFEPFPIFLESQTDDSWFRIRSYLDDTQTVIETVAKLDSNIANDVREMLFNRFAEVTDPEAMAENPYHKDMLYQEREGDPSAFRLAWWEFRNEIQHRARFFSTTAVARLREIFADLDSLSSWWGRPVIRQIKPGDSDSYFWRGRTVYSERELKEIIDSPSQEMGPPPTDKAKAGRMNSEGIPVFYGGLEEETCVAEIRPPVGSYVALGRFELLTPVRILDLGDLSISDREVSHFDPKYSDERSRQKFLREWVEEISRPVMPHDEAREYLASQVVADFLANKEDLRLDGIMFSSSQTAGKGRNIVLFNHVSKVAADDSNPEPGLQVRIPRQPTVPPPGANPRGELTVRTAPPEPREEGQQQSEADSSNEILTRNDGRSTTLRLDRESIMFHQILGVNHDSKVMEMNALHYLTAGVTSGPMSSTAVVDVRNPNP